eukprot:CAMPEP_0174925232 /NCGR_PEP_ID=MMETSP1355-20121228/7769_1 /TAXON_ID=464990 /ORGANISM="Hemiselmis tepida, Strain CCMP443" /LENGTH=739 /DNA_ID=CAMNT_0016171123 /DNA_START=36 /DNA_END=2255 /DNA_ORIENTATION=+
MVSFPHSRRNGGKVFGLLVACALMAPAQAFLSPASVPLATRRHGAVSLRPSLRVPAVSPLRMMSDTATEPEKFEFKAEVTRVMDIIINSLYSEKDVFLRELVSNAADACDKKRFLTLGQEDADELAISVKADKERNVLIIEDTGVGMTRDELINNLGKIAESGTKGFSEMLKKKEAAGSEEEEVNLIGQFGVGFYSGFLVADKMTVTTKGLEGDGKTHRWESEAGQSYTVAEVAGDGEIATKSGTRIELSLREDADQYLDDFKLKQLVQKYSEFVSFPIRIWSSKTTYEQVEDEEANKDLKEGEEKKMKSVPVTTQDWEVQNTQKPLWMRPPSKVTAEQYEEFYKSTFKVFDKPLTLSHFSLEGQVEFKALLFIPTEIPWELTSNMFDENSKNMRLYVKRVFINDNFQELCPRWLKFVKGVVDSEDLPLNVGREILQKSSVLRVVSRRIVKKSLDMIDDLREKGGEDWDTFQKNFGKYLKVGVVEDNENRKEIGKLVKFYTSADDQKTSTFSEYVERMKEGQDVIYFLSGEGRAQCKMSPAMEKVKDNGYEVMFAVEPVDELVMMELNEFDGKEIVDLAKGEVKGIDDKSEKKEEKKKAQVDFDAVLKYLEETVGKEKISKAEVSLSLTDSPALLAQGENGMSPQMQKYMKARAVAMGEAESEADLMGMGAMGPKGVLQINPNHPIITKLKESLSAGAGKGTPDDEKAARLLYHVASLRGGYEIEDPAEFASLVTGLMG